MNRRNFLQTGAAAATAAGLGLRPAPAAAGYYELTFFYMQNGPQVSRLETWLRASAMPLFARHGVGPVGVFKVAIGEHTPHVLMVIDMSDPAAFARGWQGVQADPAWAEGMARLEQDGPAFDRNESRLLRATPYAAPLAASPEGARPGIFEYRLYHAPTERQLARLHERFAGPEIPLFHKHGIRPILYGETVYGPDRPSLVYLTPFESLAAREAAWAGFRADPEWTRVSAASVQQHGEIVGYIHRAVYEPTPYSQIL